MIKYIKAIIFILKVKYYAFRFKYIVIRAYRKETKKLVKATQKLIKDSDKARIVFNNLSIIFMYEFIYGRYLYCSVKQDNAKWYNKWYWDKEYDKAKDRYVQYLIEFSENEHNLSNNEQK